MLQFHVPNAKSACNPRKRKKREAETIENVSCEIASVGQEARCIATIAAKPSEIVDRALRIPLRIGTVVIDNV